MKYFLLLFLISLSSCSSNVDQINTGNNELWVMVKIDSNFRSLKDLELVDKVTKHIENKKLGILDGHSSGGYQLDFNFININNAETARNEITKLINASYPNIEYTLSNTYEVKYEKL